MPTLNINICLQLPRKDALIDFELLYFFKLSCQLGSALPRKQVRLFFGDIRFQVTKSGCPRN